jgi:hypothetical protein
MDVDLPDDVPEPGIFNRIDYWGRCIKRRWAKVENKVAVVAITGTVIAVMMPIVVFCCQLCEPDPFAHMKTE